MTDRFGTEALRAGVLASWADSPTRFREDANAEEDLLLGGYADRWLVELAQNAADAAQRAGTPGRLWVRAVRDGSRTELRVANTGVGLDADAVAALASLRASSKRDSDAVGRFGVGFAAVLGVSGEPRIVSTTGGVLFSRSRTGQQVRELGGVAAEELARRGERPPVLRLCWPVGPDEPPVPDGYHTEVRLPTDLDPDGLLAGARATADELLLALPWLVEVTVGQWAHRRVDGPDNTVTLQPADARWLLARRGGQLGAGVDNSVESRAGWTVCWALPLDEQGRPVPLEADVLHAPTPSDERLALPARLFATLPMQPTRRRVRNGPATDAVLEHAAEAYLDLVRSLPPRHRLAAVPRPGFPRSEVDESLRAAITSVLSAAEWLPAEDNLPEDTDGELTGDARTSGVQGTVKELAPRGAVLLELPGLTGTLSAKLAELLPGLLSHRVDPAAHSTVLSSLGARVLPLAEVADRLAGIRREPRWWRELYAALAGPLDAAGSTARDELAALPVPLVDGRTVAGPRTALVSTGLSPVLVDELVEEVRLPGLRIVHPDAVHPLLHRLGAIEAGPVELLDHPSVAEAVSRSIADAQDGLDTGPLVRLVLGLVAEVGTDSAARPWLAGLALPDADGEPARADELMLPDAAIAELLAHDAPIAAVSAELVEEYPRSVLTSVGVLDSFAVLIDDTPTGPDHDLDDEHRWWDSLQRPPERLVAVRDLDLVREDAWPAVLALLAADPNLRAALRTRPGEPEPYTAWWLARNIRLAGQRPDHWRLPGADELAGLFDPVPEPARVLGEELLASVGVRRGVAVPDACAAETLLCRLADPARTPDAALVWAVHAELAEAVLTARLDPAELDPPSRLRALDGSVLDAADAVLLDHAWLAGVLDPAETVGGRLDAEGAAALAELLDLPLASEVVQGHVVGEDREGEPVAWSRLPEVVTGCAALGIPVPAGSLVLHQRLTVQLAGASAARLDVPVWLADGELHTTDPLRALVLVRSRTTELGFG